MLAQFTVIITLNSQLRGANTGQWAEPFRINREHTSTDLPTDQLYESVFSAVVKPFG